MNVVPFHCGPFANESERKAFEYLSSRLRSAPGDDEWILLTNLTFSVTHQLQADEIDLIVIGPPGVCVIEIKHWTSSWIDSHENEVETEADRLTNKARKIGTTLRRNIPDLPFVLGSFLVTQEASRVKNVQGKKIRGVPFHRLNDWRSLLGLDGPIVLSSQQIRQASAVLEPRIPVKVDGSLRRLAGYNNMELITPVDERFHRVYKAEHPSRRDRVVMHTYDLSASNDNNPQVKASREFDALHHLQIYPWAPRILDSYQEAPGYSGEMYFFTLIDPVAPSLEERSQDETWTSIDRVSFALNSVEALAELHSSTVEDEPIIHRNITPKTILCRHDASPILTSFEYARIPSDISLGSNTIQSGTDEPFISPEVQSQNLGAADHRSDIYSLCSSLIQIFNDRDDELSGSAIAALSAGTHQIPEQRCKLDDLSNSLKDLLGESDPVNVTLPPPRYWTEGQVIKSGNGEYRILSRLGAGGIGLTFKVVQVDQSTKEDLATYVAKVAHDTATEATVRSYNLARPHLPNNPSLSNIFEVGSSSEENGFAALMTWIDGYPLMEYSEVFQLLAEDELGSDTEELCIDWLKLMLGALDTLQKAGLVHGDVSPKNMIVSGSDLVLTDYDFVNKIGDPIEFPGTVPYSPPPRGENYTALASDDIYALAASFFHVIFNKQPFLYGGNLDKPKGLNWKGIDINFSQLLVDFFNTATNPDETQRFSNPMEALHHLNRTEGKEDKNTKSISENRAQQEVGEQQIGWLLTLLQAYPGSTRGNIETRGLDSEFAEKTYVESELESNLLSDILSRQARLVILCGNAGDGKTALLQRLAIRLGIGNYKSSERIISGQISDGPYVQINMDGSASWQGKSADQILDDFFEPFINGLPDQDITHMIAINDGRLLEWLEGFVGRNLIEPPRLISDLQDLLEGEGIHPESHIRFLNLNQRSLVGGLDIPKKEITISFLDTLVDRLYGGDEAARIWSDCQSCTAKNHCEVYKTASIFGPDTLENTADPALKSYARSRLYEALQAVHVRGEAHITVRELRATLVYILFGLDYCLDYHSRDSIGQIPYWDRAFSPTSTRRQGEILRELTMFDPGIDSHPQIDRQINDLFEPTEEASTENNRSLLESNRRRVYFEWPHDYIENISGEASTLYLAKGQHLHKFMEVPYYNQNEEYLISLTDKVCEGIARLEDLPHQAHERSGVVPLRITPRTPTETAFWIEKPKSSFRLSANVPEEQVGFEKLHRQLLLTYTYRDGTTEHLYIGAELFHYLMEIGDGYQLGDTSTDETFSNLSIFVQRLVREDEGAVFAWNPINEETIYQVNSQIPMDDDENKQRIFLYPLEAN